MITREELYQLIWSMPATKAAEQFSVSGSYLARVCAALDVPRPPPGYWARKAAGQRLSVPPLPARSPARPQTWRLAGDGDPTHLNFLWAIKASDKISFAEAIIKHANDCFETARTSMEGYLIPRRRNGLDLLVTADSLSDSLEFYGRFIKALVARGHAFSIASSADKLLRKAVDPRTGPIRQQPLDSKIWNPIYPTLVYIDNTAVGLVLVEQCELNLMRYIGDGKYQFEHSRSGHEVIGTTWTSRKWVPSGKLQLIAYSPLKNKEWQKTWPLPSRSHGPTLIPSIVSDLEHSARSQLP